MSASNLRDLHRTYVTTIEFFLCLITSSLSSKPTSALSQAHVDWCQEVTIIIQKQCHVRLSLLPGGLNRASPLAQNVKKDTRFHKVRCCNPNGCTILATCSLRSSQFLSLSSRACIRCASYYRANNYHRSKDAIDADNARKSRKAEVKYTKADREVCGWCLNPTKIQSRVFNIDLGITLCLLCNTGAYTRTMRFILGVHTPSDFVFSCDHCHSTASYHWSFDMNGYLWCGDCSQSAILDSSPLSDNSKRFKRRSAIKAQQDGCPIIPLAWEKKARACFPAWVRRHFPDFSFTDLNQWKVTLRQVQLSRGIQPTVQDNNALSPAPTVLPPIRTQPTSSSASASGLSSSFSAMQQPLVSNSGSLSGSSSTLTPGPSTTLQPLNTNPGDIRSYFNALTVPRSATTNASSSDLSNPGSSTQVSSLLSTNNTTIDNNSLPHHLDPQSPVMTKSEGKRRADTHTLPEFPQSDVDDDEIIRPVPTKRRRFALPPSTNDKKNKKNR